MKKIISKISGIALLLFILCAPATMAVSPHSASIAINTITDPHGNHTPPFNFSCPNNPLLNPVNVSGNGTVTGPVGQVTAYSVQIDWGDSSPVEDHAANLAQIGSTDVWNFSYNFGPHTYTLNTASTISVTIHHGPISGNDSTTKTATQLITCISTTTPAAFHIIKHVVNTGGGTLNPSNFNLHIKIGGLDVNNSPATGLDNNNTTPGGRSYTLAAGNYVISEDAVANYTGVISGDCHADGTITLASPDSKSCTITNTFTPPVGNITVTKVVTNTSFGGTAVATSFPLFVGNTPVTTGVSQAFAAPGTYSVHETNQTGYSASFSGDCPDGSITLAVGQNLHCTITNHDIQPKLKVVKVVVGGDGQVSDFPLFVDGHPVNSGDINGFNAGTHVVTENNGLEGYIGSFTGACNSQGQVTLAIGDNVTCTLTNTFNPPAPTTGTITVIKHVVNDNNGTLTAHDFSIHVKDGNNVDVNGSPFPGVDVTGTSITVDTAADTGTTYTISEDPVNGYVQTSVTGDCHAQENTISIPVLPGQNLTCTITNDDVQPKLTVTKVVINDGGGTKQIPDFALKVSAGESQTQVTSGQPQGFNAGTYTVSETQDSNYTGVFSGDCANDAHTVALAVGDNKTCTITNTFIPPVPVTGTLKVVKVVVNSLVPNDAPAQFSMHVMTTGETSTDVSNSPQPGSASGTDYTLAPGTYKVSETGPSGYLTTFSEGCPEGVVTVSAGSSTTCTVTNTWDLLITNEKIGEAAQDSNTIIWNTNHPATSRVVYDTVSHPTVGAAPNYGYAFSTEEDGTLVTSHGVVVNGLTPGTTYFFRAVSHGSPEVTSSELTGATVASSSGSSGGGGGSGSGGGSGGPTVAGGGPPLPFLSGLGGASPAPAPQVLGAVITAPTGSVAGATTAAPAQLPRTGIPANIGLLMLLLFLSPFVVNRKQKLVTK